MSPPYAHLSLLESCPSLRNLKEIHAHIIIAGLTGFTYITSRILASYAAAGDGSRMEDADRVFDQIPEPTIFNWNTMIMGYSRNTYPEVALSVFSRMRRRGVEPNMHTFPLAIKACKRLPSLFQIHGQLLQFGLHLDVYVTSSLIKAYSNVGALENAAMVFSECPNRNLVCWTSLLSGYCGQGQLGRARDLFDEMPERNEVSWSAMMAGYVQNGCYEKAIELLQELKQGDISIKLNNALLVSVLRACASSGASEEGKWVHSYIDRNGFGYGLELGTALLDFYAKCGFINEARRVFGRMRHKDATAWTAMIMGLARNGQCHLATELFYEMSRSGTKPNSATFIAVLTACVHGGLVEQGREYFKVMNEAYGISPSIEHYGCMVDMLSRAGYTSEAEELIHGMPMEPDGAIWGTLLNGCLMHGNSELGEKLGKIVVEIEPRHCGRYSGLANVYACMGRWESSGIVREVMRDRGIAKAPGWSLICIDGISHRFIAGDRKHPQDKEVRQILGGIYMEMLHDHDLFKIWEFDSGEPNYN